MEARHLAKRGPIQKRAYAKGARPCQKRHIGPLHLLAHFKSTSGAPVLIRGMGSRSLCPAMWVRAARRPSPAVLQHPQRSWKSQWKHQQIRCCTMMNPVKCRENGSCRSKKRVCETHLRDRWRVRIQAPDIVQKGCGQVALQAHRRLTLQGLRSTEEANAAYCCTYTVCAALPSIQNVQTSTRWRIDFARTQCNLL